MRMFIAIGMNDGYMGLFNYYAIRELGVACG